MNINKIIEESFDIFFDNIAKKLCIKKDDIDSKYNSYKHKYKICKIKDCKNLVINKEIHCELHYNKFMIENIKNVNNNINNFTLKKEDNNIYTDIFNTKFKLENNKLILLN
jgi:hypothetical protein